MNKRILVRLIHHVTDYDQHIMINSKDCSSAIRQNIAAAYTHLVDQSNCTTSHDIDEMMSKARDFGHVIHSSKITDGWLLQLRIDTARTRMAANDNIEIAQEASVQSTII